MEYKQTSRVRETLIKVQRISEKALVLQEKVLVLPKCTRPTLIFTCTFSNQFKLKVPKQSFPPSDFGRLFELMQF